MPNTKATGVAYADPQFDSVTVTGTSTLAAVTATTVTASNAVTSTATNGAAVANGTAGLYFLTNATGAGKLFTSVGGKWGYPVVA